MASWLKSIVAALFVTALVWVFAEAETLRRVDMDADITVQSEPKRIVDLNASAVTRAADIAAVKVKVTVEGAAGALDAAQRLLAKPLRLSPPDYPAATGEHLVNLRDLLRDRADVRELGVSIAQVQPESIVVRVEEMESVSAVVDVVTPDGQTDGAPEPLPRTVTLWYPKGAPVPSVARVTARIDDATWKRLIENRRETVTGLRVEAPAELAGRPGVRCEPPIVDVVVTVQSRTSTLTLNDVPVALRLPPEELGKFDITIPERDRSLVDVTVQGPAEFVRQVEERAIQIVAVVALTFEDLERGAERGELTKEAVFHTLPLPPGVKIDAPNKTVRVEIKRRGPAKPANGGQ